ncbi:MAG TPA: GlsB/YeaQ/YmgE family stress response membrane protein [Ilumatobacter sp.]|nr:GlsB/YeaQ/YmgE family stress response membrane protein [Ilumatobacter sp.]
MLGFILFLLIIGLVAGFLARALVPGDDSMPILHTILLGIIGSFVGGMIGYALFRKDGDDGAFQASGLIGSVVGAVLVLILWNAYKGRSGSGHRARI